MEDIKISVIIPVYNVEKYLDTCLTSVLMQTFQDFEIICINDCSTDNTINILKRYAKKDDRIRLLFNETNSGSGYSRNRGLDIAKGKYIFFLDSDDWISLNAFELLYERCEKDSLDVLIYKNIIYSVNNSIFGNEGMYDMNKIWNYDDNVFNPSKIPDIFSWSIASAPWIKIYNKSFLDKNNIRFPNENLIQEDEAFFLNVILAAERVSFLNKYLHNRRRRDNSIMASTGERILDNIQIADIMINICLNNKESYEIHKEGALNYIFKALLNGKYNVIDDEFKPTFFDSIKKLYQKCYEEYGLKEDILENVNKDILIKFEQIEDNLDLSESSEKSENMGEDSKYLTIDVGGTNIKYALMNKNAEIFEKGILDSNTEENALYDSLDNIISKYLSQIDGITLSCPGVINVEEGILHTGGAFNWISNLPLKSILEKKYDKRVWIENDGKCAALAELWKGNLKDVKNGVTIGLGTGIAGGIILNGELYRGVDGSAAEFSSILENFDNPNKASSWHKNGSYKGLIISYAEAKGLNPEDIDGIKFFEYYHNGDEDAIRVLKDYAKIIASGIINLQVVLNVEKFCIGGGISSQDVLINEIKSVVHDYFENKASKAIKEPIVDRCFFENNAGCVGALYNFLKMEDLIE